MNLADLKDVILSQREEMEEGLELKNIIEREVDKEKLKRYIEKPNILVILGVRRCGKSVLSWLLLSGEKFGYINFDDERLLDLKPKDLDLILQAFYELYGRIDKIVLDEPQNIQGWELFVNRLRRRKGVIVTGSNSQLLSGELATHLTGRYVDFLLYPFSFREFLIYQRYGFKREHLFSGIKRAELKRYLEKYMLQGGFPERYLVGGEILARIYGDIVEKDIVRRLGARKRLALKEFVKYLISNTAREFSLRRLAKILDIKDVHTIKNWLEGVENSYLGFILIRYSPRLKEQIIAPKKFYAVDTGLITSVSFRVSRDIGRIIENLVAVELMRRKSYWNRNMEIYYWKDHQQREVDFVVKEGTKIEELIQVTYISARDEIERREIKALEKASEELRCKNKTVITWDYEEEGDIKFIPLWKWLLTS